MSGLFSWDLDGGKGLFGVKRTLDRLAEDFPICRQCVRLAKTLEREGLAFDEERAMEKAVEMLRGWVGKK